MVLPAIGRYERIYHTYRDFFGSQYRWSSDAKISPPERGCIAYGNSPPYRIGSPLTPCVFGLVLRPYSAYVLVIGSLKIATDYQEEGISKRFRLDLMDRAPDHGPSDKDGYGCLSSFPEHIDPTLPVGNEILRCRGGGGYVVFRRRIHMPEMLLALLADRTEGG